MYRYISRQIKIEKAFPLYKKVNDKPFGNYQLILLLSSISKFFERVPLINYTIILQLKAYCTKASMGFIKSTRLN